MATPLTRNEWLTECKKLAQIYEDTMNMTMTENEKDRIMWGLLANFELPLDHSTRCQVANAYKNLIEQHEAYKQEVSDAAEQAVEFLGHQTDAHPRGQQAISLARFIIAKPVDPLVEALSEIDHAAMLPDECANELRTALAARGGRIVFDQPEGGAA